MEQPGGEDAGDQITVEHNGVVQGATINPFEARQVLRVGNLFYTNWPQLFVQQWVNTVNIGSFRFGDFPPLSNPRTWHITDMTYDLQDGGLPGLDLYLMVISLRHNPDGWDPGVVFIDPETGKPPSDLVAGTGYKTVIHYTETNFASGTLFGS